MSLLYHFGIRRAQTDDIEHCQRIARQYSAELGFVRRVGLEESAARQSLHVAVYDDQVVGFVEFRRCTRGDNAGFSVVYHIAVDKDYRRMDIGRQLLYSVPHPVRLKVTQDNPANIFYLQSGMYLLRTETGRVRPLNVYERRVLYIWVQGNNKDVPAEAKTAGMAYGTRHIEKPRDYAFMIDIHWRDYDWNEYLALIDQYRPVYAMVADYEHPDHKETMLQQVADLRQRGIINTMVAPKFAGAVRDIPDDCTIAVSVPSSYAGYLPDVTEVGTRRVHLLGGNPTHQIAMMRDYNVVSIDGNYHGKVCKWGMVFDGKKWCHGVLHDDGMKKDGMSAIRQQSASAIVSSINSHAQIVQYTLF